MAAPYNPPVKNEEFIFDLPLDDYANPGNFKVNPTIAAGDFKISKDDGALADLATLPTVSPAGSIWVKITLSATEMNCDRLKFQAIDQTSPKEWGDFATTILTTQ